MATGKDFYESLDTISHAVVGAHEDELAEVLLTLTGHNHVHAGYDPDQAESARHTALRWLRDHGYLERTPRGYRASRTTG